MNYRITIERIDNGETAEHLVPATKVYEQTVAEIDLRAVMAAVNQRPRKSRAKNAKDEK